MAKSIQARALEERQARVAKIVWGLLLITMGVLFALDNLGRIDLGPPPEHPASHALDGDARTRWSSQFSDPQWLTVDLGAPAEIARVRLNWEAAYATAYQLQVSNDGASWTTALDVTDGHGGVDERSLSASGRYVRMQGQKRATPYGYSLYEFEVYGKDGLLSRAKPASSSSSEGQSAWLIYWPLLLVALGLPALIAPKDPGEQVVGLALTVFGAALQLHRLGLSPWDFKDVLPGVLVLVGLLLVLQSWNRRQRNEAGGEGAP